MAGKRFIVIEDKKLGLVGININFIQDITPNEDGTIRLNVSCRELEYGKSYFNVMMSFEEFIEEYNS